MTSYTDRIGGYRSALAWKAPCRVATTANISLYGLQSVDGVVVEAEDRVLVKDQADATENGIWVVTASAWSRAKDFFNDNDVVKGTSVRVVEGNTGKRDYEVATDNPIHIGTTEVTFDIAFIGGSLHNDLVISRDEVDAAVHIDADPGKTSGIDLETDGEIRWRLYRTADAETGSNAGSNLKLDAYSDGETLLSTVLSVNRATGFVTFASAPTVGTAALGTSNDQSASTGFVRNEIDALAASADSIVTQYNTLGALGFYPSDRVAGRKLFTSAQTWFVESHIPGLVYLATSGVTRLCVAHIPEHFEFETEVDPTTGAGFIIDSGTGGAIYGVNPRSPFASEGTWAAVQQRPGTSCRWRARSNGRVRLVGATPIAPILRQTAVSPVTRAHLRHQGGYYTFHCTVTLGASGDTAIVIPVPDGLVSWDIIDYEATLAQRVNGTGSRYEPYIKTLATSGGVTTLTIYNPIAAGVVVEATVRNLFPKLT